MRQFEPSLTFPGVRFSRPPWTNGSAKALSVGSGGQERITRTGSLWCTIMTNAFQMNLVVPTAVASFTTTNGNTIEVTRIATAELRIVPEPAHGLLLGAGAAALAALGHRHKRRVRPTAPSAPDR